MCAAEDPNAAPLDGQQLSRCRLVITGDARDPEAYTLNGQRYEQYIDPTASAQWTATLVNFLCYHAA